MSEAAILSGQLGLGYRIESEDHAHLAANSKPLGYMSLAGAPARIDHRGWLKSKTQRNMGSCAGWALSADAQVLNFIDTGGESVEMSHMWCYLRGQAHSGFLGSDQGASIAGCVEAAKQDGVCREVTFPYPVDQWGRAVYSTRIPPEAVAESNDHHIRSSTVMNGYDSCFAYLASGVGAIDIGITWTSGLANNRTGLIDGSSVGGQNLGGHSMAILGYSDRRDNQGRQWLWLLNSHGPEWGNQGWAEVQPSLVDWWIQNGAVFIGVSDMEEYAPRQLPLEQMW